MTSCCIRLLKSGVIQSSSFSCICSRPFKTLGWILFFSPSSSPVRAELQHYSTISLLLLDIPLFLSGVTRCCRLVSRNPKLTWPSYESAVLGFRSKANTIHYLKKISWTLNTVLHIKWEIGLKRIWETRDELPVHCACLWHFVLQPLALIQRARYLLLHTPFDGAEANQELIYKCD